MLLKWRWSLRCDVVMLQRTRHRDAKGTRVVADHCVVPGVENGGGPNPWAAIKKGSSLPTTWRRTTPWRPRSESLFTLFNAFIVKYFDVQQFFTFWGGLSVNVRDYLISKRYRSYSAFILKDFSKCVFIVGFKDPHIFVCKHPWARHPYPYLLLTQTHLKNILQHT